MSFNGQFLLEFRKAKVWDILAFEVVVEKGLIDDLDCKFSFISQGIDNAERISAGIRNRLITEVLNEHERQDRHSLKVIPIPIRQRTRVAMGLIERS